MISIQSIAWFMTYFGLLTFVSNLFQFWKHWLIHRIHSYKMDDQLSAEEILIGKRIDDCFTHCALGLIIAGFGMLVLK